MAAGEPAFSAPSSPPYQSSFFSLAKRSLSLGGALGVGTVGSVESGKSFESESLGLVVDQSERLDGLGGVVHLASDGHDSMAEVSLGGSGSNLLETVALGSGDGKVENSSEMFFGLFTGGVHTEDASGVGSVVEASEGSGRVSPLLALELDQVGVVFSSEGPDDGLWGFHSN